MPCIKSIIFVTPLLAKCDADLGWSSPNTIDRIGALVLQAVIVGGGNNPEPRGNLRVNKAQPSCLLVSESDVPERGDFGLLGLSQGQPQIRSNNFVRFGMKRVSVRPQVTKGIRQTKIKVNLVIGLSGLNERLKRTRRRD